MEKEFNEQSMAKLAIIHTKIATSQLVTLATETANPALRDQVQKAIQANLEQHKALWDAAFHAGYLPDYGLYAASPKPVTSSHHPRKGGL